MFAIDQYTSFQLFSLSHWVMIAGLAASIVFILLAIRADRLPDKPLRYSLLALFIVAEGSYQIWALSSGIWKASNFLPVQLCSFSTFIAMVLLIKRSNALFYFFFYIGFFPPLLAIVTPDMVYDFPHYFYIKFFLQHVAIPVAALFLLKKDAYTLPYRSVWIAFVLLNAIAIPVHFVNEATGGNYFFLAGAPATDTALSLLGEGWLYIGLLEVIAIGVFHLTYMLGRFVTGLGRGASKATSGLK